MSPTGPNYGSTVAQSGSNVSWTSLSNALVEDGSLASCGLVGPGGGGGYPNQLIVTGFGFNIPTGAIIDGIKLEAKVSTTGGSSGIDTFGTNQGVKLNYNGGATNTASTPNSGQSWPGTLGWLTWGGSTSLWGKSWTPTDINNANFGAQLAAMPGTGTATINVDAVRVTVYWHIGALPINLHMPKHYLYKVYGASGKYLGNLPNVISDFGFSQDINTGGSQITVQCAVAADTALLPPSALTDESGSILTDESGNTLTDEGSVPVVGIGESSALIRNGNRVVVWEYGYYHPLGVPMFAGKIKRWQANFGGEGQDETIRIYLYSDGNDMANHLVRGSPFTYTLDQSQASEDLFTPLYANLSEKVSTWNYFGQTFTVGAGVTNIGAITLLFGGSNVSGTVTVTLYNSPTSTTTPLASASQFVGNLATQTAFQFNFPVHVPVTAGAQYFFTVTINSGGTQIIYYSDTNPYSGGGMYKSTDSTGGWIPLGSSFDLYFKTYSSNGATVATYSTVDPTAGMLEPILSDYNQEGGLVTYTSSSIQATGLSVTAGFNVNTVYEAVQEALTLSPSGFYFYVDLGTSILTFKQASAAADLLLVKGKHLSQITIAASIEYLVNMAYLTGGKSSGQPGDVPAGQTIFTLDSDATSIAEYGQSLDRPSDTHVTDSATGHIVGGSEIATKKKEAYLTTVTIVDKTMDITTVKPGLIVGFRGFGTFVDGLLAQIVHIDYKPDQVTIQLGLLPRRLTNRVEQATKGLIALNTINNPTSPS